MKTIKTILTFYAISIIGIYMAYVFIEPKSYWSIQLFRCITGQNGLFGFISIGIFLTFIYSIIFLANSLREPNGLEVVKESKRENF